jgi:hypothetical protein
MDRHIRHRVETVENNVIAFAQLASILLFKTICEGAKKHPEGYTPSSE